jgi:hypothetical protein
VRPVSVLNTVEETVVLCNPEAILELLEADGGVEGIARCVERCNRITVVSAELFLGEVLVELGVCELLEALDLLVLSGNQLGLKIVSLNNRSENVYNIPSCNLSLNSN